MELQGIVGQHDLVDMLVELGPCEHLVDRRKLHMAHVPTISDGGGWVQTMVSRCVPHIIIRPPSEIKEL